ncbi:MarR family winged helix-turn-helix transcriptional regulator [Companilactobacillus sp.]|jgi:DNA-binding MarR family transcriptional regulator|uniref:MarR family winged helix-turn-helix transcriptional regulator n=1 Tax=Companilactobacillus sp. TaxID=2767905 RepID=UPI0025BE544E|nr:hypothetical protein [Companilactobacillus sp.]MCH4010219.1 hypothetical protein [Companilactobacillus sp.]MCH4052105.1 hypothetical protein [Companilactobacillus sp.]MCH4078161.1 hypothetical protein [Companilactobacillus sp.]MCH4126737.1 hypothetical protein [Companilactobacillus sp.]MCH4132322.1 hypothetical protein [Companilactobacillus sp.]
MNEILNLLKLFVSQYEQSDMGKIGILQQTTDAELKKIISQLDPRELQILGLFEINTDVSLKELPNSIGVSQASASRSAKKLEDLDLVVKHKTELNNKEWLLALTETGKQVSEIKIRADQKHQDKLNEIAKNYSAEQLQDLADILRQIIQVDD